MKNLVVSLVIGAGALFSSGANAAPISMAPSALPDTGIEQVRLVCDDYGRCYRTRGGRRVVIQQDYGDSYNYAPRERYIERPDITTAATTTTVRASESAWAPAASGLALAWARAGNFRRPFGTLRPSRFGAGSSHA